ncbi:MAG: gamma-glutamylcyclotransferase family protein [Leptolyngbyaceae cyanobacterium bins.349]|nr:gamma-glutamylcyclotransferase family protein [Leptolyngbyaceae cyanobacterium bins.349]
MSALIKFFVYGTLKPGEMNHRVCAPYVVDVQPAIATGQVYHLPFGYPAMTLEEHGQVHGHLLTFIEPTILAILDELEHHDPEVFQRVAPGQSFMANQYQRREITVVTPRSAQPETAWGYVMTPAQIFCLRGQRVPSGCWTGTTSALLSAESNERSSWGWGEEMPQDFQR